MLNYTCINRLQGKNVGKYSGLHNTRSGLGFAKQRSGSPMEFIIGHNIL